MEYVLPILAGTGVALICVFFYTLGLTHGIHAKNGTAVKLKPLKAIAEAVTEISEVKEKREQTKEEEKRNNEIREMMAWNGDNK